MTALGSTGRSVGRSWPASGEYAATTGTGDASSRKQLCHPSMSQTVVAASLRHRHNQRYRPTKMDGKLRNELNSVISSRQSCATLASPGHRLRPTIDVAPPNDRCRWSRLQCIGSRETEQDLKRLAQFIRQLELSCSLIRIRTRLGLG